MLSQFYISGWAFSGSQVGEADLYLQAELQNHFVTVKPRGVGWPGGERENPDKVWGYPAPNGVQEAQGRTAPCDNWKASTLGTGNEPYLGM